MADRFYCPGFQLGQASWIEGDEARHLARVRRVGVGAEVEIFDGRGNAARAEVIRIGRDRVDLLAKHRVESAAPASVRLILGTAIPKGDRFDWLIEKATELGVERVVPLVTERSTVDPRSAKLDRLRRAIVESCKQCRRDTLMELEDPQAWDAWVRQSEPRSTQRWVAHPGGNSEWIAAPIPAQALLKVAIGPEGGFSDGELGQAQSEGWGMIRLTGTTLRIETAALCVAASLLVRPQPS